MDQDPWNWTAAEVQLFFRDHATQFIQDKPGAQLPDNVTFLPTLSDNDVDGASLLTEVDAPVLRDDFAIQNFRVRAAILHCIRKLRSLSLTYRSQHEQPTPYTPRSDFATPKLHALPSLNLDPGCRPSDVGENVRPGETRIQDSRGKTRRRLELTNAEPTDSSATQHRNPADASAYLPDRELPVDKLFFGETPFGHEIRDLQPSGDIYLQPSNPDRADQNFGFYKQANTRGEADFIHSRMLTFLNKTERWTVTRRGQDALAVLPYREGLQRQARSATVIQANKYGGVSAMREPASLLESHVLEIAAGTDELASGMDPTGEWDFLIDAHPAREGDEGLPLFGDSESVDAESTQKTLNDDDSASQAESVQSGENLGQRRADEFIEECIAQYRADWKANKLPQLEKGSEWTTWKKTKKSKTLRDALIAGAHSRIESLNARLKRYKDRILEDQELTEETVKQTCKVMEVTVHDREKEKWKISVWQKRTEPAHVVQHRKTHAQPYPQISAAGSAMPGFIVHPDDRMSASPTPATHVEFATSSKVDEEEFHTPAASPVPQPTTERENLGATDDMSVIQDGSESDSDHQDRSPTPEANSDEEDPMDDVQLGDSDAVAMSLSDAGLKDFFNQQTQVSDDEKVSSENELPSPSTFISTEGRRRLVKLPLPTAKPQQSQAPIDLTLSSDSPAPSPSPPPCKRPTSTPKLQTVTNVPEDATSEEIVHWDMTQLSKQGQRKHLLIKLLHSAGPEKRSKLHQMMRDLGRDAFIEQLQAAIQSFRDSFAEMKDDPSIMSTCVGICVFWWTSDIDILQTPERVSWNEIVNDKTQLKHYFHMLDSILARKGSRMFVTKPKKRNLQTNSSSAPLEISSSSDERADTHTPHKRRRREVQQSQTAMASRRDAHARQDRYKQRLVESQISDAVQLEAMLASDSSKSDIEVNPAREDDQDPIYVHPDIARKMKAHQIDGVRFLWREVTGGGQGSAQGCILAHTMGLGKTMQTIALLVAIAEASQSENPRVYSQLPPHMRTKAIRGKRQLRILVICPPSLLINWRREIREWAKDALSPVSVIEAKSKQDHAEHFKQWDRFGGVLLIGYQHFLRMTGVKSVEEGGDTREASPETVEIRRLLFETAEIVVSDEVHTLKNQKSATAIAASRIKTESRIGLTGTPMSNDVEEIYALVSFVAPGFFGDVVEFRSYYANPIKEGNRKDSDRPSIRKSMKRLAVLRDEIDPKVHRADITVLKGSLKAKVEFVLFVPLLDLQRDIYKRFLVALKGDHDVDTASQVALFAWLNMLTLLTNHPLAFKRKLLSPPPPPKKQKLVDSGTATPVNLETANENEMAELTDKAFNKDIYSLGFTESMVQAVLGGLSDVLDPLLSSKTSILMDILRYSEECGDKTLIFSTSIVTLDYLDNLFNHEEIRFSRIDGKVDMSKRTKVLEDFHNDEYDVMLISTRAGGVGLNIQGANRVVIFDFSFNPVWEEQAIGRAYRLGQQKPVYVYRFVAGGTFETNIYNRQLFKTSLAQRVVDKKNPRRNAEKNASDFFYEPKHVEQKDLKQWHGKDKHVLDRIIEKHGTAGQNGGIVDVNIRDIVTMETLQEEAPDEPLNDEEKREVDEEIRINKTRGRRVGLAGPAAAQSIPPQSTAPASLQHPGARLGAYATSAGPAPTQPVGGSRQPTAPDPGFMGGLPPFKQW